ncbi:unnamed protein product [Caenorhabditis auriculariae]|uniref:Ubiquitin-activating enzyme E1 C-terminal domain-containing protein n=1 Tax=Caenorhabditis auriculariae TaxID=2777116 RepID=A0A8S1HQT1_9PELO|nr:unnamed protein product [Caenorhabditis auriculariae]
MMLGRVPATAIISLIAHNNWRQGKASCVAVLAKSAALSRSANLQARRCCSAFASSSSMGCGGSTVLPATEKEQNVVASPAKQTPVANKALSETGGSVEGPQSISSNSFSQQTTAPVVGSPTLLAKSHDVQQQQLRNKHSRPNTPEEAPIVVSSSAARTMSSTGYPVYEIVERGSLYSLDYRLYFKGPEGIISPWHDIPLFADKENQIFNMIVEIPRWTNAKMEMATKEAFTFPQTWEDPNHIVPDTGAKGDNDPLDVIEIGSKVAKRGAVLQVKVLGTLALIDEGETDWKIVTIDVNDPAAAELSDITDVERVFPGLLAATVEWFRLYKIPAGKPANEFAFNGEFKNREYALKVIDETALFWQKLIKEATPELNTVSRVVEAAHQATDDAANVALASHPEHGAEASLPEDVDKWHFSLRKQKTTTDFTSLEQLSNSLAGFFDSLRLCLTSRGTFPAATLSTCSTAAVDPSSGFFMTSVLENTSSSDSFAPPPTKKVRTEIVEVAGNQQEGVESLNQTTKGDNNNDKAKMAQNNAKNGNSNGTDDAIDKDLYSRQIYALGESAMLNLRHASVLISGLGSVGVEIAKNLILGGVRNVTLHDTRAAEWHDLSAQYYLTKENLGENRAAACRQRLAELNDTVNVGLKTAELTEKDVTETDLIILTDTNRAEQLTLSKWARVHGRKLLVADARGLFSYIFVDLGEKHVIDDRNGEQVREFLIEHVDRDTGDVTTLENLFHGLEDGDFVTFSEVKGMDELNGCQPLKITVKKCDPYIFNIGNAAAGFGEYLEGGRAKQVKLPSTISFKSLEDSIKEPEHAIWDFAKFDYPDKLHALWAALYSFEKKHGRRPAPRSDEDAALLKAELRPGAEVEDKLVQLFSYQASGNLVTVASVVGGIAAQEAMKAVTRHMTPLKQFLYLDHLEALPGDWTAFDNAKLTAADCQPRQSRYDGQAAIFGWPYQEALFKQRWFVVGAGAIGCELLKNMAMMGVACGEGGLIKITDMDQIEISNLNRQFLFRRKDVGQKKSEVAARAVTQFNKDVHIKALAERVGADTENIFNDDFFEELNGVANALDNVDARRYMDRRCVYYRLPLLESGTMGTKGNTQVVYPHLTESYSSSADPPEKEIPVCTLKNFPNEIQHTIQWAREQFESFFNQPADMANKFLVDERGFIEHLEKLAIGQRIMILQQVKDTLIDKRPTSAEDCVRWARDQFQDLYHNAIAQMLHSFPPHQLTDSGAKFWSGAKRCPHVLQFDASKPEHFNFVYAASILRAQLYGIQPILDKAHVASIASSVVPTAFKPLVGVKIATTDAEAKQQDSSALTDGSDDDAVVEALKLKLARLNVKSVAKLEGVDFEKDDDTNHHIEFVAAASNLRAENYDIEAADSMKTKQIAGRIIPALATTTAAVAGLVCIELYKIIDVNGIPKTPLDRFKNGFINLALPFFGFSEPIAAPKKKYGDKSFTLWDRIDITGPITLEKFITELKNSTGLDVSMVSAGACLLYAFFMPEARKKQRLNTDLRGIYEELTKKKIDPTVRYIVLEPMMTDPNIMDDDNDVEIPYIRYSL